MYICIKHIYIHVQISDIYTFMIKYDMCTGAYPTVRCNLLASKDALWGTRLPGLGLNAMRRCWLIRMSESKDVWLEFTGEGIWSNMAKHILCYVCIIYTQVNIYTLCIYIYLYIHFAPLWLFSSWRECQVSNMELYYRAVQFYLDEQLGALAQGQE